MDIDLDAIRQVLEQDGRKISDTLPKSVPVYYNGGGHFVAPTAEQASSSYSCPAPVVLARYAESAGTPNATVFMRVGAGRALLCGTHPEFSFFEDPLLGALSREPGGGPSPEDRIVLERNRIELCKALLLTLDIGLPDSEDKDKLQRPTHPLPQFLVSHPTKPNLPTNFVDKISTHFISPTEEPAVLADANDTFHFHNSTSLPDVSAYVSESRSTTLSIEETDNLDKLVKHVIVADKEHGSSDLIDRERWTPLFDWSTFWSELDAERKVVSDQGGRDTKEGQTRLGDLMLYSEAVTSTQTMLDKSVFPSWSFDRPRC
jgi:biotin--protein ligase